MTEWKMMFKPLILISNTGNSFMALESLPSWWIIVLHQQHFSEANSFNLRLNGSTKN